MIRCEFCGEFIDFSEYDFLSENVRYSDDDVYITHKTCETDDGCSIVEVIETSETLHLVRVDENV